MTCASQVESIGSMTSPCVAGCGLRAPRVRTMIADRITASQRMAAGQECQVRLDSVPDRDASGRIAHLIGLSISGTVRLTTSTTTNDAVPAYEVNGKFSNFFLEDVSGHQYLAAVDGRSMVDDVFFRNYHLGPNGVGNAGLATNIGTAQDNDVAVDFFFPFLSLHPKGMSLRGAIPLKAIKDRGDQALRFTVAALSGYTSVTDNGWQGTVTVFAHLVYLPLEYIDSGWQLEHYTLDDSSGKLRHADRIHEYAIIRGLGDEDIDLDGYAGISLQTGNDTLISAYSYTELLERNTRILASDLYADSTDAPVNYQNGSTYAILIPRSFRRPNMAAGPVTFNYATRNAANTRYLHRTILCQTKHRATELGRAVFRCGCGPEDGIRAQAVDENMMPTRTVVDPAAAFVLTNMA